MTRQTDRWDRCKALAAQLKQKSLELQLPPVQASLQQAQQQPKKAGA